MPLMGMPWASLVWHGGVLCVVGKGTSEAWLVETRVVVATSLGGNVVVGEGGEIQGAAEVFWARGTSVGGVVAGTVRVGAQAGALGVVAGLGGGWPGRKEGSSGRAGVASAPDGAEAPGTTLSAGGEVTRVGAGVVHAGRAEVVLGRALVVPVEVLPGMPVVLIDGVQVPCVEAGAEGKVG
jgi:hypothetical protein